MRQEIDDSSPRVFYLQYLSQVSLKTLSKGYSLFWLLKDLELKVDSERVKRSIDNAFLLRSVVNKTLGIYFSSRPDLILESLESDNLVKLATRKSGFVGRVATSEAGFEQISRNNEFLEKLLKHKDSLSHIRSNNRLGILLRKSFAAYFYNDPKAFKAITHNRLFGSFLVSTPQRKSTKEIKSFASRLTRLDKLLRQLSKWFEPQLFEPEITAKFCYTASSAKDNIWNHLVGFSCPKQQT